MTRWWISWASTPRMTARPCSSAIAAWCAIEASSAASCSVNGVSRSQTSSPICRRFHSGSRIACLPARPLGPRDRAVLEHERRAGRVDRVHRRLHDLLERLLEVERVGDGLRDARERLELGHAPLGVVVEPRVVDRLRHLRGDREQQVDLALVVRARLARAQVERALKLLAHQDRHGEDRLVLLLVEVGKDLEARVEVRLRSDHHGPPLGRRGAGDPLARPQPRQPRLLLDARPVRRAQHELVGALGVEVDEAGVCRARSRSCSPRRARTPPAGRASS